ncbi:MAG: hypothetical protein O0V67_10555, partial [Methanocorpusculum sp.]|nr:hypothetical protein [Methanocorpusculum sp.]
MQGIAQQNNCQIVRLDYQQEEGLKEIRLQCPLIKCRKRNTCGRANIISVFFSKSFKAIDFVFSH